MPRPRRTSCESTASRWPPIPGQPDRVGLLETKRAGRPTMTRIPRVHNKFTRQARSIALREQCLTYHGHTGHQHARWSSKTWPPSIGSAWACRRRREETHVSQAQLLHERSTPHEQVAVEPQAMHPTCACQWLNCACHLGPAPAVSLRDVIGGMMQGDSSHVVVAGIPKDHAAG